MTCPAVVPQFRAISNSLAGNETKADLVQNGRVLAEHISRSLAAAKQIVAVSLSSNLNGYITFTDNNSIQKRYMLTGGYVVFGAVGSEAQLAGPVNRFQVSCYSLSDFANPITDANNIRLVRFETDFSNAGADKTFSSEVFIQTNANVVQGLLGYWKFDEGSGTVAIDSSGNGNNGTINGNPVWGTGSPVNGSSYLDMDGVNDYVDINHYLSLPQYTAAMWFRIDSSTGNRDLFSAFNSSEGHGLLLEFRGSDSPIDRIRYIHRYPLGTAGQTNESYYTTTTYGDGQWHHLAAVRPSGSTRLLYVDGNQVASTSSLGAFDQPGKVLVGMMRPGSTGDYRYWNGGIDDVRVYNRALSAAEIANLANVLRYRGPCTEKPAAPYNLNVAIPTPPVNAGDLLIAAVSTDGDSSSYISPPAGQGWTLINCGCDTDSKVTLAAWWKIAGASEPNTHNFTWTAAGVRQAYGWMMRFTGQSAAANPINASSTGNSSGTAYPISPAVTTTVNNCLILRLGAFNNDDIEVNSPGLPGHIAITMNQSSDTNSFPAYAGFKCAKLSSDSNFITILEPNGTVQGNLLVAAVATDGNNWGRLSAPSGWNSIMTWNGPPPSTPWPVTLGAWWKLAGASEPASYTFGWPASTPEQAYGWIMRFVGSNLSCGSGYPAPLNGTSSSPACGSSNPGPSDAANVITLRLGAFYGSSITVDSPGLPDHNAITMDSSNTGAGAVSGGAGYRKGFGTTSNFSLTASQVYATASPCILPSGSYANTCSGGAGYVMQPNAGGSGTSTFTLGSSNEARMITIAIAPASQDPYTGGEVRP